MHRAIIACLLGALSGVVHATDLSAATYTLYDETDPNSQFVDTTVTNVYDSFGQFVGNNPTLGSNRLTTHGTGVTMRGLTWDGTQYVAVYESDPGGLPQFTFATFASYNDLVDVNSSSTALLPITWGTGVSVGGLAHDGDRYLMVFEADPEGLNNATLAWFDTFNDLWNFTTSGTQSWSPTWGTGSSVSALAHDGTQYILLTESDPGPLNNFGIGLFDTFDDLRTLNFTSQQTLGQNYVDASRSIGGLAGIGIAPPETGGGGGDDVSVVPLPASAMGLFAGLMVLGAMARRRNQS